MILDDILQWAPDNEDVFNELKASIDKGSVIPFVGAGLSCPIYPQWKEVLIKLSEKLSSESNRKAITSILNDPTISDAYTKAADKLIELRSETNVFKDILKIFNENKINDVDLTEMSVYLLPFLFSDKPAITTNYDCELPR